MSQLKILIWLIAVCSSFNLYTREIIEQTIEPAIVEVRYEFRKNLDTLTIPNDDFKYDLLTLKAGLSSSAFFSHKLKYSDSIEFRHPNMALERIGDYNAFHDKAILTKEKVFKYFHRKKLITHDRFDLSNWLIEEDLEMPSWNILDSTKNILGYDCVFATTEYRGRTWNVWFAPEIPIGDGPWKLCGLPGLILKAEDSKGHYVYEASHISTLQTGYVEYFDYEAGNRLKTSRKKGLTRKYKSLHDDIYIKIISSGAYGIYNPNVKERATIPHTNYDFQETDYPHE